MTPTLKKYAILTLLFFAVLAGIIWRIEVEYNGWNGLIWLSYYHYATPIAFFLFLAWANLSIKVELPKRIALNLVAFALAYATMIFLLYSFTRMFTSGPSAMIYLQREDPLIFLLVGDKILAIILPIFIALASRIFGVVCRPLFVLLSCTLFFISPHIGIFLLDLFGDKGHPDYIHTIKGGQLLTLWFFSSGLVFIRHKQSKKVFLPKDRLEQERLMKN